MLKTLFKCGKNAFLIKLKRNSKEIVKKSIFLIINLQTPITIMSQKIF